jgi:hypothetical protein
MYREPFKNGRRCEFTNAASRYESTQHLETWREATFASRRALRSSLLVRAQLANRIAIQGQPVGQQSTPGPIVNGDILSSVGLLICRLQFAAFRRDIRPLRRSSIEDTHHEHEEDRHEQDS